MTMINVINDSNQNQPNNIKETFNESKVNDFVIDNNHNNKNKVDLIKKVKTST